MSLQSTSSSSPFTSPPEGYSENPFFDRYSTLDDTAWEDKVVASIQTPELDGLPFPRFPPKSMQVHVHGHSGVHAIREAFDFYRMVQAFCRERGLTLSREKRLLDFGSGWGRTIRPFMCKIDLKNLFGYEPALSFCQVARALNPYVNFVHGNYEPPTIFADKTFDLVVAWSVFTHLPSQLAQGWFDEFVRIVRPGGLLFLTFWGQRFIDVLAQDKDKLLAGEEIHWYHKVVIEHAGDLTLLKQRYTAGDHVFVASSGANVNYGEAFVSPRTAGSLASRGLELVTFDQKTLPQDLLVFRRS